MKVPHLLRVEGSDPAPYLALMAAGRSEGLRVGWLVWGGAAPAEEGASLAPLEQAARAGALRAVAVTGDRMVSAKVMVGPPVLRDVLRQHFLGASLVLVALDPALDPVQADGVEELADLPRLAGSAGHGGAWQVETGDGPPFGPWTTAELVARLRKPRPWGDVGG